MDTVRNIRPRCSRLARWLPSATALALLIIAALNAVAAAAPPSEFQVKAAFLLNFTKFVDWPAEAFTGPASPINICVLGDDPFGAALDEVVSGEVVNRRPVSVQRIRRAPSPKSCQVVFVSKAERDLENTLSGLGSGVLTVGEGESFVASGGMIAFVIDSRRVRFDINQSAAEAAALKVSSQLLKVARVVHNQDGGGK